MKNSNFKFFPVIETDNNKDKDILPDPQPIPKRMSSNLKPKNPIHPYGTSFDPFGFTLMIKLPSNLQSPPVNLEAMQHRSRFGKK